jgi:hypothetical protein
MLKEIAEKSVMESSADGKAETAFSKADAQFGEDIPREIPIMVQSDFCILSE